MTCRPRRHTRRSPGPGHPSTSWMHHAECGILRPVAEKPIFAGITPRRGARQRRHLVAVVAFDGVVLGDLAAPCEVFGRANDHIGQPTYEVRVCGLRRTAATEHVSLTVRWPLTTLRKADTI